LRPRASRLLLVLAALACAWGAAPDRTAAAPTFKPAKGATVTQPPTLRWQRVRGARLYNVQVYRDGRKIMSRWPRKPRFAMRWRWEQRGRTVRFRPAVYRWYVWPYRSGGYGRLKVSSWFQAGSRPSVLTPPALTGDAREGALLTVSSGRWGGTRPIRVSYRWQRCDAQGRSCLDLGGAQESARILTSLDIDATVRVVVEASNWLGSRSVATAPTATILPAAPTLVARPKVHGRPQVGRALTADVGAWTSSRPLAYTIAWELCRDSACRRVAVGSRQSLRLRASALGRSVRVVVSAANHGGSTEAESIRTDPVGVTREGTPIGEWLTGSAGSDVIMGRGGDDRLSGQAGPDLLIGGRGRDWYRGGAGNDIVRSRDGREDVIRCGVGTDLALVDQKDRVSDDCEDVRSSHR
jgi:hypothetical protein